MRRQISWSLWFQFLLGGTRAFADALDQRDLTCKTSGGFFSWLSQRRCPYADMSPSVGTTKSFPLRGRLVWEDVTPVEVTSASPGDFIRQHEIQDGMFSLTLVVEGEDGKRQKTFLGDDFQADEGGYVDVTIVVPTPVEPGRHVLELDVNGQAAADIPVYLVDDRDNNMSTTTVDLVVRSDIDKTYLATDFDLNYSGMMQFLRSDSTQRKALPAMPSVYEALRAGTDGIEAPLGRPLTFLSGSAQFFKRTMEGRMTLDGIVHDTIWLKPWKNIAADNVLRPWDALHLVKDQIGYKLGALLQLRLEVPSHIPEILLGDDSEADFVVYALYHRFTSGEISTVEELDLVLESLEVDDGWRDVIRNLARKVQSHLRQRQLSGDPPVKAIYIRKTDKGFGEPEHFIDDWTVDAGIIRFHDGTWPLTLDLYEEGYISEGQVESIRTALEYDGVDRIQRTSEVDDALARGFLGQETANKFSE